MTSSEGVIETQATTQYVNLAIMLDNDGNKAAGSTQVEAWVPSVVSSTTLKWHDSSGEESRSRSSVPDPAMKLPTGDGRTFDTQRITRTLDAVPLMGETLYLRLACPVGTQGESMIPIRVRATTDGSEAELVSMDARRLALACCRFAG